MIFLLFPVFNEELNIENLFKDVQIIREAHQVSVVFVDDGSSDKTVTKIKDIFPKESTHVISFEQNQGPGAAFNAGFKYILSQQLAPEDVIVTMESDCTSDIGIFNKMIAISRLDFDLVLASVYAQGGGFEETSFFRLFLSKTANFIIKTLYGIKVNTYTSFYRVYKIDLLRKVLDANKGEITLQKGFICKLDILRHCVRQGATIIEVPMKLTSSRRQGKSKMKIKRTITEYIKYFFTRKS